MNDLIAIIKNIPTIIESSIVLKKPNTPLNIFNGKFQLLNPETNLSINVHGKIIFEWIPNYGCFFIGTIKNIDFDKYNIDHMSSYKVIVDEIILGSAFIYKTATSSSSDKTRIKGVFENKVLTGNKMELIDNIIFSIPNLMGISGEVVKKTSSTRTTTTLSRILLDNQKWKIIIDKSIEYQKLKEELETVGGYNILYTGKISLINDHKFTYEESEEIINCLDSFLSFINGRRISTLFLHGYSNEIQIWADYSPKPTDAFKDIKSSFHYRNTSSLDIMWKEFSSIWESNEGKDFLKSIVHWYIQSNNKTGLIEGAIIMAQAGLEKLYYWIFSAEKKHPNDTPQKLRILIKYLNIDEQEALLRFSNLKGFYRNIEKQEHRDIAGAITTIRNDVIHPKETFKIDLETKKEALQISIWLIEMTLLKILKHKGQYFDRARGKEIELNSEFP
jgi:hypothetical protein